MGLLPFCCWVGGVLPRPAVGDGLAERVDAGLGLLPRR